MTNPFTSFAPTIVPPRMPATDVSYVVEDTAVGRLLLAVTDAGVLVASVYAPDGAAEDRALQRLADRVSPRVLRRPAPLDDARRELAAYLAGGTRALAHRTDLVLATPFQREVLSTLAHEVGYGERTTYGGLAAAAHHPGAARAVGTALGHNPLCVFVPCHRVLPAGGSLGGAVGGYAGGPHAKAYLLELEEAGAAG
jgi:methylated-DNA-[protein]-cysteine S-methyltransferase